MLGLAIARRDAGDVGDDNDSIIMIMIVVDCCRQMIVVDGEAGMANKWQTAAANAKQGWRWRWAAMKPGRSTGVRVIALPSGRAGARWYDGCSAVWVSVRYDDGDDDASDDDDDDDG